MDIRPLSPAYAVSPQICAGDITSVLEAGFKTVICNRPDAEITPEICGAEICKAAEAAGLTFIFNPITPGQFTPELLNRQARAMCESDGPVLAYCASGNRSSIVWALINPDALSADELIQRTAKYGYQHEGLRSHFESRAHG